MKKIPYSHQWIDNKDIKEVVKVLKSDWLTQGPKVEEFEKAIAKYCNAKYGVAFSSGTSALYAAYKTAGIKEGDEVVTTPLTFVATSNMISVLGAKPVFVDVEQDTLNINPELIERLITSRTKAIATVDFAGVSCDYDKILKIAKKNKLLLIEDACHALGTEYKGRKLGSFADIAIVTFHPVKHITTGEGGVALTNNKNFYEKLKIVRNHGIIKKPEKGGWYYEVKEPSFNFRITDIQCALGISQLKKIDRFLKRRREIIAKYNKAFKDVKEIILPTEKNYLKTARYIYPIQVKKQNRKKVFSNLQEQGIGIQIHYMPLHLHPFYKKRFEYKKGDFPIAEEYYERAITIPLFPKMTNREVDYVIKSVKKAVGNDR
ncbi:MAG: UDP-4-amino-4,6-dideoxy-N-acetyl-beta-L-altrosamine transaminase [Candidatus Staskawiczbacteria bacterium RIFOXYC1_FULL_37_43]|nr:MAG: UDP-4-amino-4,6-dideoxy-N-acetyl-beta-L-altrosamine transaminase [Candidatus Staskawiczbacteria bacterium RIFOXYA1_FULL_37_15]OGZ77224.1 MAG: UDP-4-amino-4,6-dideoxy-N-acetyl-beta-L-altrosamine transaminase [Candidatus Staskawiczbacteria bacterium RIFOXYA12_FULL_37_10]OGZ80615.1 MAG: UDP-4-amino-4,6-dideoxy-N-acetyl-beta-L-altrosamine transaminase [Candidatus Staskawiczbacteria bacterium RIFOXYB1_FULL_38_37]OGZ82403.1 MAG: UDP-4-amino-4,6-dideoxy-N-acetyl-beta-L-altrosamine transaminase 